MGRIQQDLLKGNSNVGLIATAVNRERSGSAYTGGVDWNLFWRDNAYQLSGQVAGSRTDNFGQTQSGAAAQLNAGYTAGRFQGVALYETLSPEFDANDLGFISRVDRHTALLRLSLRWFDNWNYFHRRFINGLIRSSWNYDRLNYQKELDLNTSLELKNFWWVRGGAVRRFQTLDDLDTRGGPPLERPASTYAWGLVSTDVRRLVSGSIRFDWERDEPGSVWRSVSLQVEVRPSTRVELNLQPRYTWNDDDAQWIANVDDNGDGVQDHFVYGELESRVFEVTGRCNLVFTRDLSLQLYMQPFVAVGDYENFKELARPRSYEFTPYAGLSSNPDFRRRSLRSNWVLRWEYRPGSTLFLVWSQSRRATSDEPELRPWTNLRKSFADEGANIFLVKLNYWMNI